MHIVVVVTIILVTLYNIRDLVTITILNDEFGYWSNAALVANRPWETLAQHTPYYCFGYSILLIPLFYLFSDTSTMYHAAIVLNCIMLIGEYFIAYRIIRKTAPEICDVAKIAVPFSSVMLCTNMFYSQVAWSECFFSFVVWVLVYAIFKLEERVTCRWVFGASISLVLLFITHQRAIGLFIPFVVSIVFLFRKNRKRGLMIITALVVVIAAYCLQRFVSKFQLYLIGGQRVTNLNELVVNNDTVCVYLDMITSRFQSLLVSICGKLSVMLFSTFGLGLVLIVNWCHTGIRCLKKEMEFPHYYVTETFITLSLIIMLALQSVQMMEGDRTDIVVYTRYFDFIFGPIILFASPRLFKNRNAVLAPIGVFLSVVGIFVINKFSWSKSSETFNVPCSPFIGGIEYKFGGISCVMQIAVWVCVVFFILWYSTRKLGNRTFVVGICVCFFCVNWCSAYYANDWLNKARYSFVQRTDDLLSRVDDSYSDLPIVYLCNTETDLHCADMKFLQFALNNKEVLVQDDEESLYTMEDYILIVNKKDPNDYSFLEDENIRLLGATSGYFVYYVNRDNKNS